MKLVSYTFTKDELWNTIRPSLLQSMQDLCSDVLDHPDGIKLFQKIVTIKYDIDQQIQLWCDLLSLDFFKAHPDVSDVLLLVDRKDNSFVEKTWIASR